MNSYAIAAAYRSYVVRKLSLRQLSLELWTRYGFPNAKACENSIRRAFHKDGYQLRDPVEAARMSNSTAGGRSRHVDPEVRNAYQRAYRRRLQRTRARRIVLASPLIIQTSSAKSGSLLRDRLARRGWETCAGGDTKSARIASENMHLGDLLRALRDFADLHSDELHIEYRRRVWLMRPTTDTSRDAGEQRSHRRTRAKLG